MTASRSQLSRPAGDATVLPRLLATATDPSLEGHFRQWGPAPPGPVSVSEVARAGLWGRGGAGFPSGRKLTTLAATRRPVLVANGTEGEPASLKDKTLMVSAPHLVLDGIRVAAETIGAEEAILCVDRNAIRAIQSLRQAVADRAAAGGDGIEIRIETAPTRYVAGEESALVHWLNGGEVKPTFVPPRPFEKGVRGRPTLVHNVETLADLALIARFGADWFRALGTPDDPGTGLFTVVGDTSRPGVYEVSYGTSFESLLASAGADASAHSLLVGGYAGTWIAADTAAKLTLDRRSLTGVGATIGCASVVVLGQSSCGLDATARVAAWMAGQSAGQCGPCVHGLPAIAHGLEALVAGDRRGRWESQLQRWVDQVDGRGACHHPDGVARMVRSALKVFSQEIDHHRRHGPCQPRSSTLSLPLPEWRGPWR